MSSKSRAARRRWTVAFKKRVVAEASQSGVSAAQIARRYDLNANLLFNWKKKYGPECALVPVKVVPDGEHNFAESSSHRLNGYGTSSVWRNGSDLLEIDLPCGIKLRCGSDVNSVLLARILTTLRPKP